MSLARLLRMLSGRLVTYIMPWAVSLRILSRYSPFGFLSRKDSRMDNSLRRKDRDSHWAVQIGNPWTSSLITASHRHANPDSTNLNNNSPECPTNPFFVDNQYWHSFAGNRLQNRQTWTSLMSSPTPKTNLSTARIKISSRWDLPRSLRACTGRERKAKWIIWNNAKKRGSHGRRRGQKSQRRA